MGPCGHYRPCGPVGPYGYSMDPMALCAPWAIKCLAGHLPLMIQSYGDMSVEFIVELYEQASYV